MKKIGKKIGIIALVVAVLGGGGYGAFWWWTADGKQAAAGSKAKVVRGELVEVAQASGKIEPHVQVEVKSRGSGEVIEVLVKEGQAVKTGDLLVRLDPTEAERAILEARASLRRIQADLTGAYASLSVAKLEQKNTKVSQEVSQRGVSLGLISTEEGRNTSHSASVAEANVKLRQAQAASSQVQLELAQLAVDDAELKLKYTKIFSPIDGTVLAVGVEKGSMVSSALTNVSGGTAVVTIADLKDLRVIGAIDEAQISRVKVDQPVIIRVDAYAQRSFEGKVLRVSPLGKEVSNVVTFDVEIIITDKDAQLLRSGMSADLEIVTAKKSNVLLVPLTAIQSSGRARSVRLAGGETRRIRTGSTDGTSIEVLQGLEEGDELIIGGAPSTATARPSSQPKSALPMGGPRGGRPH